MIPHALLSDSKLVFCTLYALLNKLMCVTTWRCVSRRHPPGPRCGVDVAHGGKCLPSQAYLRTLDISDK